MAFGIDDALSTATAGIKLASTVVDTISRYRRKKQDVDLERLLEEVRITALGRIDEADLALGQFERMLVERKVDIHNSLADAIAKTPFWKPFEQHRLSQIQKRFNHFADSIYSAADDIAALVRCRDQTGEMGMSVTETTKAKHELQAKLLGAASLKDAIWILRMELARQKKVLS